MLSSTFIDEFGYLNLKPEQSNIFFKLMEERYRQHPPIITTNLGYDEWAKFLGNRAMVEAFLNAGTTGTVRRADRLLAAQLYLIFKPLAQSSRR